MGGVESNVNNGHFCFILSASIYFLFLAHYAVISSWRMLDNGVCNNFMSGELSKQPEWEVGVVSNVDLDSP